MTRLDDVIHAARVAVFERRNEKVSHLNRVGGFPHHDNLTSIYTEENDDLKNYSARSFVEFPDNLPEYTDRSPMFARPSPPPPKSKARSRPSQRLYGASASAADVPQVARLIPNVTSRADFDEGHSVRVMQTGEQVVRTLTSCLDAVLCRESVGRIFRTLYAVALEVARLLGHVASATRVVFHLPAELLMAYLGLKKSAFYENLAYLHQWGLVASKAHMSDLRGKSAATGTLWVVALQPERVLSGHAPKMVLRREDHTARKWRDLNADVKIKRTAYALTGGRKGAGQSRNPNEGGDSRDAEQQNIRTAITLAELVVWAKTPFLPQNPSDTLTVRPSPTRALEVVWALGDAAQAKRHERAVIVDRQARALAAAFGDGADALGFWRKLIWNLTRGLDAGENVADDVAVVLARVLADVRHDLSTGGTPPRRPAAVVNAALGKAGLLDRLRSWEWRSVGSRPAA